MLKIVLATTNHGKIRELNELLAPLDLSVIAQSELGVQEIEETGLSFIENAILKARHAAKETGLPALADDSGLAVAALQGAPGIYSARYAGPAQEASVHNDKLLADMQQVPDEQREAAFHCVLAFMINENDPIPLICQGKWSGRILHEARGSNGFGYDPLFYVPSEAKSAAELTLADKMKLSHRGMALRLLLASLPEKLHELSITG